MRLATYLALGAMVISGVSNFVNKFAVTASPGAIPFTFAKNALVAIALVGIILLFGRMKEIRALRKDQWTKLALIGAIGGSVPFGLYFTGLAMTSAINASLIHKTLVLWIAVLAIFFLKERLSRFAALAIAVVFSANFIGIGGFVGFRFNAGELMILAATILWAIESVIAKKALVDISSVTVAGARMIFGSVLLFFWLVFTGKADLVAGFTGIQWGWALLTAILLLGYVLSWYTALKHAPATYVATLLVPATLVTNLLSAAFITKTLPGTQLVAILMLSSGVALALFSVARMADARSGNPKEEQAFSSW